MWSMARPGVAETADKQADRSRKLLRNAKRLASLIDEMLDVLINRTGRVGL